jgi:hypothetical protein
MRVRTMLGGAMRRTLQLDPDSVCDAVSGIEVDVARRPDGRVTLRYLVSGLIRNVLLPAPEAPVRAHQLWEHSCFELFIRPAPGEVYCEFNFAPSRQWAAYSFRRHRSGMADIEIGAPAIKCSRDSDSFEMRVDLDVAAVPELAEAGDWQLNISTIIEEANGRKSYWALAHPPGKADFHNPDCFVLHLPPAA